MSDAFSNILTLIAVSITTTSLLGIVFLTFLKKWIIVKFDAQLEKVKAIHAHQLAAFNAQIEGDKEMSRKLGQ